MTSATLAGPSPSSPEEIPAQGWPIWRSGWEEYSPRRILTTSPTTPMKKNTNKTRSRQITRREFVCKTLLTAGIITGAPALLRGQNLNNKLNIAFIACGGRGNANLGELTVTPGRSGAAREQPVGPH